MKLHTLASAILLLSASVAMAQSSTDSPYSQFALGMLADQSSGFNRGMNGTGIALHEHNQLNYLNPASYASIDSLSFIFDVGMSGQFTNFKENGVKKNDRSASFEYVMAAFRLYKHLGLSFGLIPSTNVGYSYSSSSKLDDPSGTSSVNSYSGSGGLHQIYLGLGWSPFKGFSIGANGSYLYGSINRYVVNSFSSSSVNSLSRQYSADVRNYKLDFGVQYTVRLSKKDEATIGVTYSHGHKIGGKPSMMLISSNSQTSISDTVSYPGKYEPSLKLEIPTAIGVGLMFNHDNKLKIAADYTLQRWSDVKEPVAQTTGTTTTYTYGSGQFKNRHKGVVGVDYCPGERSRSFFNRVHYKAGVGYATPYYYINGQDGPKEMSASLGFSIPIINSWNNRSMLNISAQWIHQNAKNFITDNSFRINVGITFNERWFAKWKVD